MGVREYSAPNVVDWIPNLNPIVGKLEEGQYEDLDDISEQPGEK